MKYKASNVNHTVDIDINNTPIVTFKEVAVLTADGGIAYVQGSHYWNYLTTDSDLTPLIGQWFNMESDEWKITDCIMCVNETIFFRHAERVGIQHVQ